MGKNSTVVTISFSPPELLERAKDLARTRGFKNSFSAYVTKLVEDDLTLHDAPSSGYGLESAKGFLSVSGELARGAASEPPSKEKPGKHPTRRRSKKKTPS